MTAFRFTPLPYLHPPHPPPPAPQPQYHEPYSPNRHWEAVMPQYTSPVFLPAPLPAQMIVDHQQLLLDATAAQQHLDYYTTAAAYPTPTLDHHHFPLYPPDLSSYFLSTSNSSTPAVVNEPFEPNDAIDDPVGAAVAATTSLFPTTTTLFDLNYPVEAPLLSRTDSIEGIDRQHQLERGLSYELDGSVGGAGAAGILDSNDPVYGGLLSPLLTDDSTTLGYTSVFSPSPVPSSPPTPQSPFNNLATSTHSNLPVQQQFIAQAAAQQALYPPPPPPLVDQSILDSLSHVDRLPPLPDTPPTLSTSFQEITTRALTNRINHGIVPRPTIAPNRYKSDESDSPSIKSRKRSLTTTTTTTPSHLNRTAATTTTTNGKEGLQVVCSTCSTILGRQNFRGRPETLDVPLVATYFCLNCVPLEGDGPYPSETGPIGYGDTLSAVLDGMQGLESDKGAEERTEMVVRKVRPIPVAGIKRDLEDGFLTCDVCKKDIGTGSLRPQDPEDPQIHFGVELVCVPCQETYARCSDCGGGGGARLGVGKWRSRDLFPDGRKTCQLSHLRLGSLEEMAYDCWAISDLPPQEVDQLVHLCRDLFYVTLVTTMATPDHLEAPGALASTFEQVHRLATDGWTLFEPLIREDIEKSTGKKRYIALRFSTPIPRKKAKATRVSVVKRERMLSNESENGGGALGGGGDEGVKSVLRPGKKCVGFVLAELDMNTGTLFVPLTMPTGSVGDTYEASSILLQTLTKRVFADLAAKNVERVKSRLLPYPAIKEAWTMALNAKDPRGVHHLETRRGFLPLDKYSATVRSIGDPARFDLARTGLIPRELTHAYQVFVRDLRLSTDDWCAQGSMNGHGNSSGSSKRKREREESGESNGGGGAKKTRAGKR